jgi:hypothetical protein
VNRARVAKSPIMLIFFVNIEVSPLVGYGYHLTMILGIDMIHKDHPHLYLNEFVIENGRERSSRGGVSLKGVLLFGLKRSKQNRLPSRTTSSQRTTRNGLLPPGTVGCEGCVMSRWSPGPPSPPTPRTGASKLASLQYGGSLS